MVIVGGQTNWTQDDPDIAALGERARQSGWRARRLRGHVPYDRVPEVLAEASVALLPLPDEPVARLFTSPLKLFDYIAAGVPIVASDLPALREVLRHEQNALLATPGDADSFAAAVTRILADPEFGDPPWCASPRGCPPLWLGRSRRSAAGLPRRGRTGIGLDHSRQRGLSPMSRSAPGAGRHLGLQPDSGWGRYSLGLVRGLLERGVS